MVARGRIAASNVENVEYINCVIYETLLLLQRTKLPITLKNHSASTFKITGHVWLRFLNRMRTF